MNNDNAVLVKSKAFALSIIRLYQSLVQEHREYIMSRQLLKCGTSIGANVREAIRGQSKPDFYSKLNIALKEASETEYWLELLHESGYLPKDWYQPTYERCQELIRLLVAITKTQRTPVMDP